MNNGYNNDENDDHDFPVGQEQEAIILRKRSVLTVKMRQGSRKTSRFRCLNFRCLE